ncbi:MAG: hypothetical protein LBN34_00890 [Clostridiales Family XIII bacterium]|jgi:hypothetical protein|nr:hypothetical protein [Clostridiales Family XIII bacterium]
MLWMIKKISENDDEIIVGYNPGSDKRFDGRIVYNRKEQETHLESLAEGSNEFDGKKCAGHTRTKILKGLLKDEPVMIALG